MSLIQSVRDIMRNFHNTNSDVDLRESSSPVLNKRAIRVKEYYKNYPYVVVWDNNTCQQLHQKYVTYSGHALEWCSTNCTRPYTTQILRVSRNDSYCGDDEWVFNEIGGEDICFWAFSDERDAMMFSLKWS